MTEPFIFLRTVVPLGVMVVMGVCVVALSFLHERIKPRDWGLLI
jgi:hypothetical protein